jgi:hypothetical protein
MMSAAATLAVFAAFLRHDAAALLMKQGLRSE